MCGSVRINGDKKKLRPGLLLRTITVGVPESSYNFSLSDHMFARMEKGWTYNPNNLIVVFPEIESFWEGEREFSLLPNTMLLGVAHATPEEHVTSILTIGKEFLLQISRDEYMSRDEFSWYNNVLNYHHRCPVLGAAA